jgi:hypothetical protein
MTAHGTNGRYSQGCRCDPCTDAHSAYHWRNTLAQRERGREDPSLIPHGTTGGYRNWGCRCKACTAAALASSAAYRESRRAS